MGTNSSGSARTAPKGRATRPRNAPGGRSGWLSPTLQWILVVLAGLLVVGAVIWFGSDVGSDLTDDGNGFAPVEVAPDAIAATTYVDAA